MIPGDCVLCQNRSGSVVESDVRQDSTSDPEIHVWDDVDLLGASCFGLPALAKPDF